jgi:hypothetical protein
VYKLIKDSNSQSGQESFVLSVLKEKISGTYLEIGAFDAKFLSNTFLLEKQYGWKGLAVEINPKLAKKYNKHRKNLCVAENAITLNYQKLLSNFGFPKVIDYLQLDIEPASNTYNCLINLPHDEYKFRVITFEHDLYAEPGNYAIKKKAQYFLKNLGYLRVADSVMNEGNPFEDWYVYPPEVPGSDLLPKYSRREWKEMFRK